MSFVRHHKLSEPYVEREEKRSIIERLTTQIIVYSMWMVFLSLFPILSWKCLKRIKPNSALVKHRLGGKPTVKYSGFDVVLPVIDKVVKINLSPQSLVVPSSIHYSKDRILIDSGLILEYQVTNPAVCVRELQDVNESVILAAKTALPTTLSQNSSDMIRCSKKLIEYAVLKHVNNAVCLWGIEILSAELSPFKFATRPSDGGGDCPVTKVINFIQKIAGHNPLPPKEKFTINEMITSLEPYLTRGVGERIDAVLLLILVGENGGSCLIDFKTLTMVANPKNPHPDATVELTVEALLSMIDNRDSLMDIYKSGKVKIDGDMSVVQRLKHFF